MLDFSILYCFLYCGRQKLFYAIPVMMEDEGWTAVQFWAYALGHLINGRLGEVIGTDKLIILGMVLSATMNLFIGFQSRLFMITVLWGING